MSRTRFSVICPEQDIPRIYPEAPLKVLTSWTYKGPSDDSQRTYTKIDDLIKKLFFKCNSPFITHLFLFFTERKNIQNF